MNPLQWLATALIRFYQLAISPLFGPSCRYYPSCSAYALDVVTNHGFLKGTGLAIWRVLRCNPWTRGGVDLPPGSRRYLPDPPVPDDESDTQSGSAAQRPTIIPTHLAGS